MIAFVFFSLLAIFPADGSSICASVSTLAGGGSSSGANDGIGTAASFVYLNGITVDSTVGIAYVVDYHMIRATKLSTKAVSTLAGRPTTGSSDGVGTNAAFSVPRCLAIDTKSSLLYITDSFNSRIRQISLSTQSVSTIAGSVFGSSDGIGTLASFSQPFGIVLDSVTGIVYVTQQNSIRAITLSTKMVTTIAGAGGVGSANNGVGTLATFSNPSGIFLDSTAGILYVADQNNNLIRKIILSSKTVSTLAGNTSIGSFNGIGTVATFNRPSDITFDPATRFLYVVDMNNNIIRAISLLTMSVSTFIGNLSPSGLGGFSDGVGTFATFKSPYFITTSTNSSVLYVTDNNKIRVIENSLCPAGGYSLLNNSWTACPSGTWSSLMGAESPSACKNCSMGKFSALLGATNDCTNSSAGSYSPVPGAASQIFCSLGSFCPAGSSTETPCPQGTYSRDPAFPCIPCIAGTYGNLVGAASSAACYPCPQGSFCPTGSSFATPCPLNTYSITPLATSNSTCLPCPASTYTMSPGQTSCMSSGGSGPVCSSGTYLDYASSTNCTKCSAGTFNPQSGSTSISSCLVCSAGSYSSAPGSSSCMPCSPGKFSPVVGASSASTCLPCELGTFNPYFGLSSCPLDCPAGYFGTSVGGGVPGKLLHTLWHWLLLFLPWLPALLSMYHRYVR